MQNNTPLKISKEDDPNEYYEVDFTSGKKITGISKSVYVSSCKPITNVRKIVPFRNIMENQEQMSIQCQNEANDRVVKEAMEMDRKIKEKLQKMREHCMMADYKRTDLYSQLKKKEEQKLKLHKFSAQLLRSRKQAMYIDFKVQEQRVRVNKEVQQMRDMMMETEKGMYQANKLIFTSEKEFEFIHADTARQEEKTKEIENQIKEKEECLKEIRNEEGEIDAVYQQRKVINDIGNQAISGQILQLAVLKMQLNHYLRVGFQTLKGEQSVKKKILEKNPNIWQKKNKILYNEEILYYILIQLYPSWHRLLNQLSYHFIGYKQLLFQKNLKEQDTLVNLEQYIFTSVMKKSINKGKSYVVVFSPLQQTYSEMKKLLLSIKGLNNGIIHIEDTMIIKNEVNEEFIINYTFKNDEKVKTFQLVRLLQLTKESLIAYLPRGAVDKTSIIKIQVPFCFQNVAERLKMEEIYRLIERQR